MNIGEDNAIPLRPFVESISQIEISFHHFIDQEKKPSHIFFSFKHLFFDCSESRKIYFFSLIWSLCNNI